ncbi:MAG: glycerophosphodiester phosphodiesterase family protein [Polyangiaceae bacterium]
MAPRGSLRRILKVISFGLALGLLALGFGLIRAVWPSDALATGENKAPSAFFTGLPPVLNIAHRGASSAALEHTLEAYALALAQGADVLELDVHATKDGVLVVAHDADLERTVGIRAQIAELDWQELSKLAGERAPLKLDDVLQRFPGTHFNLELKPERDDVAVALARAIHQHALADRVIVASFHVDTLAAFRRASGGTIATSAAMPEAVSFLLCYLMQRRCQVPFDLLQLPARFPYWLGTAPFNRFVHEQGLKVQYWTVDDPALMRTLIDAGADGIMTNRPERLSSVLTSLEPRKP